MPRKARKSLVGHPSGILFWSISLAGVFQQPSAIEALIVTQPVPPVRWRFGNCYGIS